MTVTLGPSANDVDYLAINDAYERFLLPINSDQYGFNTDTMGPNPVNGVHVVKLFDKLRRTELFRGFGQIFNIFSRVRMGNVKAHVAKVGSRHVYRLLECLVNEQPQLRALASTQKRKL
ncbi:hypothetical protein SeLEV6574_g08628, partial [Synchytrium endobioticum]